VRKPVITLTTDFGTKDPFVGIMKGVILGINPEAEIVDIAHTISPQNILEAAHVISMTYQYFPRKTIHVAVVDPGVGGRRKPLLVVTEKYYFIGPDNGVFTSIIEQEQSNFLNVIHITSSHYFLPEKGPTFHGRDIFAPVAAWLSRGIDSTKFGEKTQDYVVLPTAIPRFIDNETLAGEVTYIDSFGNAITNITRENMESLGQNLSTDKLQVIFKGEHIEFASYYEEKEGSGLSAIMNSFEFLELFLYKGNASEKFGIHRGDPLIVKVSQLK
jgi:S-adenosylmethionine hydrolase